MSEIIRANLGKAEDSVHTSGDFGIMSLGVANEAQTTLAADGDYIAQSTDTKGNMITVGNIAHDGVDAGNPVKIGGTARTTNPTAVADADRVNASFDKLGKQVVVLNGVRGLKSQNTITLSATTTETSLLAAGAAGVFHDLAKVIVSNTSGTECRVDFRDATAGTIRFSLMVGPYSTSGFSGSDLVEQTTSAAAWTAQCGTSVTDIIIFAQAVKNL